MKVDCVPRADRPQRRGPGEPETVSIAGAGGPAPTGGALASTAAAPCLLGGAPCLLGGAPCRRRRPAPALAAARARVLAAA
ncbi:hypothetical protein ACWGKX_25110, partial [Streptomyces tricolor]